VVHPHNPWRPYYEPLVWFMILNHPFTHIIHISSLVPLDKQIYTSMQKKLETRDIVSILKKVLKQAGVVRDIELISHTTPALFQYFFSIYTMLVNFLVY